MQNYLMLSFLTKNMEKEEFYEAMSANEFLNETGVTKAEYEKWLGRWTKFFEEKLGLNTELVVHILENFTIEKLLEIPHVASAYQSKGHTDEETLDFLRKKYIGTELDDKQGEKMVLGIFLLSQDFYEQRRFLSERGKSPWFKYVKGEKERTAGYIS